MKFFSKLNILFLGIVIFTSISISAFSYYSSVKALEKQIKESTSDIAFNVMDKIDRMLFERYQDVQMIAADPVIKNRNSSPNQITERLIEYRNRSRVYVSLSFFDLNRLRIADTNGMHLGLQHDLVRYWRDVLAGNISAASDVRVAEELHMPIIYFASLVKDKNNEPFGVVVLRMPIFKLHDILKEFLRGGKKEDIEIELADKEGILLYSTSSPGKILKDKINNYKILNVRKRQKEIHWYAHSGKEGNHVDFLEPEKGYLDFQGNDWLLLAHVPKSIIYAPALELTKYLLIILGPLIILVIFISYIFSRMLARPLISLNEAAEHFSKGELDYAINVSEKDEIGEVARAFADMARKLKASYEGLEEKVRLAVEKERQSQEKVKEQLAFITHIVNSLHYPFYVVNLDYTIALANKAAEDFGLKVGECCYRGPHRRSSPCEDEHICPLKEALRTKKAVVTEHIHYDKAGNKLIMEVHGDPVLDKEGNVAQMIEYAIDVSVQKKAEEKIREAAELKSHFISMVSHELRTPLSAIKEAVSLVVDGAVGPVSNEQKVLLAMAGKNTERLGRLINDVLDFQKIEAGKLELRIQENSIAELIEEVVKSMMPVADSLGLKLKSSISEGLVKTKFDRDGIAQVLYNLVNNAIKFTEKGSVEVGAVINRNFIEVRIEDTGCGVKEEDKEKLFKSFSQVGDEKSRKAGTTGLGLVISKGIIEAHKGRIWFESQFGKGTTFYFNLPIL